MEKVLRWRFNGSWLVLILLLMVFLPGGIIYFVLNSSLVAQEDGNDRKH